VNQGGTVTALDSSATSLLANDSDPDGDNLTVSALPVSGPTNGAVTFNTDGTFSYTHNGGQTSSDSFVYQVCDDGFPSQCATATVSIMVNNPPNAVADSGVGFTTDEDTAFTTGSVLSNDTDPNASDTLSVQGFDITGTLGVVTDNGDGTFNYNPNGQFESLNAGEQTTDSFSYTVTDGNGGVSTTTVTITINGVDDPTDVTFNLSLQGRGSSGPAWTMPFEVEFYALGTATLVTSATPTTASSTSNISSFVVMGVMPGTYDIWVKGENTPAKRVNGVNVSSTSNVIDLGEQMGGNANQDNIVDGADYSGFLLVPFGSSTSGLPPAQQLRDHNRDGIIDITDYAVIIGNFGQSGEAKP
jgi:VCBS repeat-containing protein